MHSTITSFLWLCVTMAVCCAASADKPAVNPIDLLSPEMFLHTSFGMGLESVQDGTTARVVTTGAEFLIDKVANIIECRQRIAKERSITRLKFRRCTLSRLRFPPQTHGTAIFSGRGTTIRINGDSLLMVS